MKFSIVTIIMFLLITLIGPMDIFVHGFYFDTIDYNQIEKKDFGKTVPLNKSYTMDFSPSKEHFKGFLINLIHQPEDNTGTLLLTILDQKKNEIDTMSVDLSNVKETEWYCVYSKASLQKNKTYTLKIHTENCKTIPYMQTVASEYLPDENISENLLIGYAYAKSTFTLQEKVLLLLFILVIWGFGCTKFIQKPIKKKYFQLSLLTIGMGTILAWNYMYDSMNGPDTVFPSFQMDSETLVTGVIMAEQDEIYFREEEEKGYGLGRYYNVKGELRSYNETFVSDDNWINGYSKTIPAVIIDSNIYTKNVAMAGNYVRFKNKDIFQIADIADDDTYITVYLDHDSILNPDKYGPLDNLLFYDMNMNQLAPSIVTAYKSQYGFQGKVFRHMARYMDSEQVVANLNLICCIAAGIVFACIVLLIAAKYNLVMAGIYFVTFWLSPWITNFARNLYWVEFTWFIPMFAGLFCAWKIHSKRWRIISYIVIFIAVFGKCLCGYEYLSTILLGMMSFLLADFIRAILEKDKIASILYVKTILIVGIIAFMGFIAAIAIHASLRGDGNIWEGIKDIFEQDILRRTIGADFNAFPEGYWESFNASAWETFCLYFHFPLEIIIGVHGNLFPLLCTVPLCIFVYDYYKKQLNIVLLSIYIITFLASVSWFCLAKSHSYIHTPLNYVLWYFGFVQICFYTIVNKLVKFYRSVKTY